MKHNFKIPDVPDSYSVSIDKIKNGYLARHSKTIGGNYSSETTYHKKHPAQHKKPSAIFSPFKK
jgi:hypothetical protein